MHEHSGALLHRLSRRHGRTAALRSDGLRRLVRGVSRRTLVYLRPTEQRAADRASVGGKGPRCDRHSRSGLMRKRRRDLDAVVTTTAMARGAAPWNHAFRTRRAKHIDLLPTGE